MKIIKDLFRTILNTYTNKEVFVYLNSYNNYEPFHGYIKAIDDESEDILLESLDDVNENDKPLCVLIKFYEISHITFFKQNGKKNGLRLEDGPEN